VFRKFLRSFQIFRLVLWADKVPVFLAGLSKSCRTFYMFTVLTRLLGDIREIRIYCNKGASCTGLFRNIFNLLCFFIGSSVLNQQLFDLLNAELHWECGHRSGTVRLYPKK
jgi:hypothetical protein